MPLQSNIIVSKDVIMNTLGDIEFNHYFKKHSDEDYNELKSNYSGTAVLILKDQKETNNSAKMVTNEKRDLEEIEREIEEELIRIKEKVTQGK